MSLAWQCCLFAGFLSVVGSYTYYLSAQQLPQPKCQCATAARRLLQNSASGAWLLFASVFPSKHIMLLCPQHSSCPAGPPGLGARPAKPVSEPTLCVFAINLRTCPNWVHCNASPEAIGHFRDPGRFYFRFCPAPNACWADPLARLIAAGLTSWPLSSSRRSKGLLCHRL